MKHLNHHWTQWLSGRVELLIYQRVYGLVSQLLYIYIIIFFCYYYIVLYYIILHYIILHYIILYYIILYYIILYYITFYCITLKYYIKLYYILLCYVILCFIMFYIIYIILYYIVLYCITWVIFRYTFPWYAPLLTFPLISRSTMPLRLLFLHLQHRQPLDPAVAGDGWVNPLI